MQKIEIGYIDGCFDLMHIGHIRILAQARCLCKKLIVGIHNDAEIALYKGAPPVVQEAERYALIERIAGVDSILPDAPYEPSLELLDSLGADMCFHGEDMPAGMHGASAYEAIADANRLCILKRTDGVSTTDIISHLMQQVAMEAFPFYSFQSLTQSMLQSDDPTSSGVVYVQGSFDMLHAGHVQLLADAAKQGAWLLVGVTTDGDIEPVSTRISKVAACKGVCDVIIIDYPVIQEKFIRYWKIDFVVRGSGHAGRLNEGCDYAQIERSDVFVEIVSKWPDLCSKTWSNRVHNHYSAYLDRQRKKQNQNSC